MLRAIGWRWARRAAAQPITNETRPGGAVEEYMQQLIGNETIILAGELPHGLTRGTAFQETLIKVLAYSSAPTGVTSFVLIL
jgi:hypothetical protein